MAHKPKSEQNEMELRSFHHWTRSQNWIKMAKLWPPKDLPKVAGRLILSQLVAFLATFVDIWPPNLLCLLLL